jgi:hypothetical protein
MTNVDAAEDIAQQLNDARARRSDGATWEKLSTTSRASAIAAVAELLERGVISLGPAAGALPVITAPEAAERSAAVLLMAEKHAGGQPPAATALATVAAEWRNLSAAMATTHGMSRKTDEE